MCTDTNTCTRREGPITADGVVVARGVEDKADFGVERLAIRSALPITGGVVDRADAVCAPPDHVDFRGHLQRKRARESARESERKRERERERGRERERERVCVCEGGGDVLSYYRMCSLTRECVP